MTDSTWRQHSVSLNDQYRDIIADYMKEAERAGKRPGSVSGVIQYALERLRDKDQSFGNTHVMGDVVNHVFAKHGM